MSEREIQTIILAGGFGKRSGLEGPKTLIQTAEGKTILEHIILDLGDTGLHNVTIVSNSKHYPQISKALEKLKTPVSINLLQNGITEPQKALGALGDLLFAYNNLTDEDHSDFLVLPSDTTYWKQFSINNFLNFIKSVNYKFSTIASDVVDKNVIRGRFGCLIIGNNGKVTDFEEKPMDPKSSFRAIPFYYYRNSDLITLKKFVDSGGNIDSPGFFIPYLIHNNIDVFAMIVGNNVIDAGVPDDIKRAHNY